MNSDQAHREILWIPTITVIVSFETLELRSICSSQHAAECALGVLGARALLIAIADMEAVETANEFLEVAMGDATILSDNRVEVAVGTEYRAILIPVGVRYRFNGDASIDWATVRYLKLVEISRC